VLIDAPVKPKAQEWGPKGGQKRANQVVQEKNKAARVDVLRRTQKETKPEGE
jgi:hypothetical protein